MQMPNAAQSQQVQWTKPYIGVTHMIGAPAPWQFTIEDHTEYSKDGPLFWASMIHRERIFSGSKPDQWFASLADAKAWCERKAAEVE